MLMRVAEIKYRRGQPCERLVPPQVTKARLVDTRENTQETGIIIALVSVNESREIYSSAIK
jgi:hypothetical protein